MSDHDRPDAVLICAAREGSEPALEALFHRYWSSALRAAFLVCQDRAGAEDVAQEAFLSAVRSLDRFDRRRPFGPWLHRITVNRAIDWTRRRSVRAETAMASVPDNPEPLAPETEPDVMAALAGLDVDHRAVIVLRYLYDMSPGEIAGALGLPRGTVNSRLRRGLDRLAVHLESERVR